MFPTAPRIDALQSGITNDLLQFLPELAVCGGIVLLLLCRLVKVFDRAHLGGVALATLVVALLAGVGTDTREPSQWASQLPVFSGLLVSDGFAGFVRILILAAALLVVLLTRLTRIPDAADSADFYVLLLGGTLGMMLMAWANHLLMVFIAVEMASLPSYAMAGFLKGKRQGSEAALKYVVYGAAASGVMLYGISLIAGVFGTGYLPNLFEAIGARLRAGNGFDPVLAAGFGLFFVGLGFKIAAVPFHFWCPDVFEGAAAEVAGFLSVASKAAAIALTLRILLTLQAVVSPDSRWLIPGTLGVAVGVIGCLTVTFGNLAAFGQTNLKRLLAYSTIAHAGYMLLAVAVVTPAAGAAVLYYLAAYVMMNLGAFAVVAFVRNLTGGREDIGAYRGLVKRSPVLAVTMTVFLCALLGLPPLAGFAGKFQVFAAVYEAARDATVAGKGSLGITFYVFLAVGAVNTAVSAYYYLRVVRAMLLDEPESPGIAIPGLGAGAWLYLVGLAALLVAAGVVWNPLTTAATHATDIFVVR